MINSFKKSLENLLDNAGFPENLSERVIAFAKVFNLKRHEAAKIINGKIPEENMLEQIAKEFEIKKNALLTKTLDTKKGTVRNKLKTK